MARGVVFAMFVVSPAPGAMKWGEAEGVRVRAAIGRRYALVGGVNLALVVAFSLVDGIFGGFGVFLYAGCASVPLLFGLVAAHGTFFGRRIAGLAEAECASAVAEEAASFAWRRRSLQSLSLQRLNLKVSWVNLAVSVALAANA